MRASGSLSSHAALRDSKMRSQASLDPMKFSPACLSASQKSCVSRQFMKHLLAALVAVAIVVAWLPLLMQHACINTF